MAAPSLPTEIVQHIFKANSPGVAPKLAFALQVASVCRQWRAIALYHTPWLWSIFQLSLSARKWDLLSALLERSRPMSLDVTLLFSLDDVELLWPETWAALELLAQHAERMQRLCLRISGLGALFKDTERGMKAARLIFFPSPSLTTLEVGLAESKMTSQFISGVLTELGAPTWHERYPALTHLTTNDTSWMTSSNERLTYFALKPLFGRGIYISIAKLSRLLITTPNLVELVIAVAEQYCPAANRVKMVLPVLRILTLVCVSGFHRESLDAALMCDISAPRLDSLTVSAYVPCALLINQGTVYSSVTRFAFSPTRVDRPSEFHSLVLLCPAVQVLVFLGLTFRVARPFILMQKDTEMTDADWSSVHTIDITELVARTDTGYPAVSEDVVDLIREALGATYDSSLPKTIIRLDRVHDARCMRDRLARLADIQIYS